MSANALCGESARRDTWGVRQENTKTLTRGVSGAARLGARHRKHHAAGHGMPRRCSCDQRTYRLPKRGPRSSGSREGLRRWAILLIGAMPLPSRLQDSIVATCRNLVDNPPWWSSKPLLYEGWCQRISRWRFSLLFFLAPCAEGCGPVRGPSAYPAISRHNAETPQNNRPWWKILSTRRMPPVLPSTRPPA